MNLEHSRNCAPTPASFALFLRRGRVYWVHKHAIKEKGLAQRSRWAFPFLHHRLMPKTLRVVAFLSSAAMMSRKAETYHPETHVIGLAELRQIIFEMQRESEQEAS